MAQQRCSTIRISYLEEAEGLEKLTIQDFNIDKYHEKWPVKPNKAMQLTAFGGS
ncbi:hypothetical protein [Aeromonas caviae]|uniref:hypothetical protein n=1 Tax=Aeromonas caviae TaxID=648 RepID=UPI001CC3D2F1|nr:hypothetical protein [Aeromonas caviae]